MPTGIERIQVNLPTGFDPNRHHANLLAKVIKSKGEGWEIDSIDLEGQVATLSRHVAVTEVTKAERPDVLDVGLSRGTKPSDGDKQAAKLADQNPGYEMTSFEPFLGRATLTRLSEAEIRCRGAAAVALGVKPWEVQVRSRADGGFDLELPRSYMPSKHDDKLTEVATGVVGRHGWYVDINVAELTAHIIPAEPPTFPAAIDTPADRIEAAGPDIFPVGRALAAAGGDVGREICVNWADSSFLLVGGVPKGGKSVVLTAAMRHTLNNRGELVLIDEEDKASDYEVFKPYVRPGGWGVADPQTRVAAIGLVNDEIRRRAKTLRDLGLNNWLEMPAGDRFNPILVVVDELSLIVPKDPPLKSLPKDHPLRLEVDEANIAKDLLLKGINDVVSKARFVNVRLALASQMLNEKTGAGPTLRGKFGNFMLMGASQPESSRSQVFANPKEVPYVPAHVAADADASRGVGTASLWGEGPVVFKAYYTPLREMADVVEDMLLPTTTQPEPTAAQIDRFMPSLDEDDDRPRPRDGERAPSGRPAREVYRALGDTWDENPDGSVVTGFERANRARHEVAKDTA
ncbi:hypothetical protein [Aeromicrobium sp. CTD01-1L150]|uniref:hypothetical protein n=1 Tax=Aeromicrobium sp. CTD01-1L150 TaxID=3341830 RepID=UPI0035C2038D